jgi:hypothetical protein
MTTDYTSQDGLSGYQNNKRNECVPDGCLTGNWEINFHGCWWEVCSAQYGKDNFWMMGNYPEDVVTEANHKCNWDTVDWAMHGDIPCYRTASLGETLERLGTCRVCGNQMVEIYIKQGIMDPDYIHDIDLTCEEEEKG